MSEKKPRILHPRHLIEVVVIFLGVWLGLMAENYREYRQERAGRPVPAILT